MFNRRKGQKFCLLHPIAMVASKSASVAGAIFTTPPAWSIKLQGVVLAEGLAAVAGAQLKMGQRR